MSSKYNSRSGRGRYNIPGHFVPANQTSGDFPQVKTFNIPSQPIQQNVQFNSSISGPPQQSYDNGDFEEMPQKMEPNNADEYNDQSTVENNDQAMDTNNPGDENSQRPHWMKPKLQGVRKISNKERRRRQNESLRRLLTPKNALMVLNEIDKGDNNFTVEPVYNMGQYFKLNNTFCAALSSGGQCYKGYGENKMAARNAAAEQAVRDMLLKKMHTLLNSEDNTAEDGETKAEEDLPMIQLASFALYKLFAEWECQGHRVPQLRPSSAPTNISSNMSDTASETGSVKLTQPNQPKQPRTQLPAEAASMHPCMLLSHMRPSVGYREVAVEGDRPQNIMFTMEVDVDGNTYTGKAGNKREARKSAARAACHAVFGVRFNDDPQ